jgi:hypothetical protein
VYRVDRFQRSLLVNIERKEYSEHETIFSLCIRPMAVAGFALTVLILYDQVANNTALVGVVVDQFGFPVSPQL